MEDLDQGDLDQGDLDQGDLEVDLRCWRPRLHCMLSTRSKNGF